jgi:AcrR family transcriptional regulator
VREPLSAERVRSAAVALADAEGLAALTMRRLAADLGVEAMSLYYYVPSKDRLLDAVVEAIVDEITTAVDNADTSIAKGRRKGANGRAGSAWRSRLRAWFLAAREVMLRHPWAPGLMNSRRQAPFGVHLYYERILASMIEAGFSYHLAHRALHAFGSMPLGFVQETFNPSGDGAQSGPTEADIAALAEQLPHTAAMVASEAHRAGDPLLGWCDSQAEFEFTLDLLLDGLDRAR